MDSSSSSSSSGVTANLQGILKSLCFNTAWKYAVFWKLKHRARMVLTWEDGYYGNCEQHDSVEKKGLCETIENLHGGRYLHDSLGSAVAKMSYHVYSLGEGIVGQAAVTGKHHWIFSDQHVTNSCSSFEFYDGWQSQFSAGIRTVAVVAVVPHGVVQLGSLNKVTEDMKLVTHIRDVFAALNDISVGHVSSTKQCSVENKLSASDLPTMSLASEIISNRWDNIGEVVNKEGPDTQLPKFPYVDKHNDGSYFYPFSGMQTKIGDGLVNKNKGIQISTPVTDGNAKKLQQKSNVINSDHQNQMGIQLISDGMRKGESSDWKDLGVASEQNGTPFSINSVIDSINLCGVELQAEKFVVDHTYFPSNQFESVFGDQVKLECIDSYQNGMLHIPEISDIKFQKNLEMWQNQTELNHLDPTDTSFQFSTVSELHVALGPAFLKKDVYNDREPENTVDGETVVMPEVMSSSHLMFDSGSENLLDAVVASVCHSCSDVKSERSLCKSVQSLLTTEKRPEPSSQSKKNTINSVVYSINQSSLVEEDAKQCVSSSGLCGGVPMSSKGFSSTCPSTCSEQLDRSSEPAKNNKKRARTGENGRPRPRDRQLIQDRIKELRELVPNGSKCSIDSLLERTIKHTLFLQSVTKHADKLSKCAESKMHQKGTGIRGSNSEPGSSWAVEVGSHLKVCSIIIENINKNGQMLVEMLCEECNHFLEIAEAIRSLGLMILKGVTEVHGDRSWICFVVEGQDNRIMHRMDVLWSLVQVLQTKTACS